MGLSKSDVLFTLFKANDNFKFSKLLTPVPPKFIGTIPNKFSAATFFAKSA